MKIVLGSQSPRRRELMKGLDIPFRAVAIDADESYPNDLQRGDIPLYISRSKAEAYRAQLQRDELLITADTIVWLDGQMLGKPRDEQDAKAMLRLLSGHTHQVYTGVSMLYRNQGGEYEDIRSWVDTTDVCFRELSEEDINYYVEHYRPLDKAGAYGIQEWIGYIGVSKINGSYFNVMGFPIQRVWEEMKKFRV